MRTRKNKPGRVPAHVEKYPAQNGVNVVTRRISTGDKLCLTTEEEKQGRGMVTSKESRHILLATKVRRNELCGCKSGYKAKKCCGAGTTYSMELGHPYKWQ